MPKKKYLVTLSEPEGRQRWTLQLLADRVVALELAESYSYESVRRVLKKTSLRRSVVRPARFDSTDGATIGIGGIQLDV